jgi:hypothetical protein
MARIERLPDPTKWRFVLVHRVIRHGFSLHVSNSRGTARSFLSLHHGEAKPTLCLSDPYLRDRLLRLGGWQEVTADVGPHTPKCWDEDRAAWKLDPEGFLPWERKPGEKLAPLPTSEAAPTGEEVVIEGASLPAPARREPRGAAAASAEKKEPKVSPAPSGGKPGSGPTPRPRG